MVQINRARFQAKSCEGRNKKRIFTNKIVLSPSCNRHRLPTLLVEPSYINNSRGPPLDNDTTADAATEILSLHCV